MDKSPDMDMDPDKGLGMDKAHPKLSVGWWGFVGLCLGVVAFVVFLVFRPVQQDLIGTQTTGQDTPKQAWLYIQSETHTGLRLARLRDFIANTPSASSPSASSYVRRAKAAEAALSVHEQSTWAALSQVRYNPALTRAELKHAVRAYINVWSPLNRRSELNRIKRDINQPVHAKPARNNDSPQDGQDLGVETLAGAATMPAPRPQQTHPEARPAPVIVEAKVKFSKRPIYPKRAKHKGVEAVVVLRLFIDARGRVARSEVIEIKARRYKKSFIRAAKRAALGSRFTPKTMDGRAVATSAYTRKYVFALGE